MKSKIESQIKGRKAVSHLLQGTRKGDSLQAAMWRHQRPVAGARHGEAHPEIKPTAKSQRLPPPLSTTRSRSTKPPFNEDLEELSQRWAYPCLASFEPGHPSPVRAGRRQRCAGTSTGPPRCQTRSIPREKQPSLGDTTQCPESSLAAPPGLSPVAKKP